MSETLELKNSNNKNIQINCARDFSFSNNEEKINTFYKIIAGEDGSIKIDDEYLPYAVDSNGWLIQIEDAYMVDPCSIIIISSDGVIAHYEKNIDQEKDNWNYKILKEDNECYYEIKEIICVDSLLSLYISTEFSGIAILSGRLS